MPPSVEQDDGASRSFLRLRSPEEEGDGNEERDPGRAREKEERFRKRPAQRGRHPNTAAQSGEEPDGGVAHRFANPGRGRFRLGEQHGQPRQEKRHSDADPERGKPPPLNDGHDQKRSDEKDRQVVGPEKQGGRERDQRDPAKSRSVMHSEKKENETEKGDESVRPGLRGVEKEKRRRGREEEEMPAWRSPRQTPRAGKEKEQSEKREEPRHAVGKPQALGRRDERLLEQIEEGRARVDAQRAHEFGWREPRSPDREDLVVPERPRRQQPEPRGARESDREERGGAGKT